jgi:PucR C-terminal helix-turn-helix domain
LYAEGMNGKPDLQEAIVPRQARAQAVIERLTTTLLGDLDRLVDIFIEQVRAIDGYSEAYSAGRLSEEEDVRANAYPAFELLLRLIAGREVPPRLSEISASIGRRRAAQGFALDTFMHAMRSDFRIVWAALLDLAAPSEADDLLHSAFRVWEAVEQHTMQAVRAYQAAELEIARAQADAKMSWFLRLLNSGGLSSEIVHQAATVLTMDPQAQFIVAVARDLSDTTFRRIAADMAAAGAICHRQGMPVGDVLIVQQTPSRSLEWFITSLGSVSCGIAPIASGLAAVPRSIRLAAEVAKTLDGSGLGPTTLTSSWIDVIASLVSEPLGSELTSAILAPLDHLPSRERKVISNTLWIYLNSGGSLQETACKLYCHRNTVLNRLHRFIQLTACDVTTPQGAAIALIALSVEDQASTTRSLKTTRNSDLQRRQGLCSADLLSAQFRSPLVSTRNPRRRPYGRIQL